MSTLITAESLDLTNDIVQVSAIKFPSGAIQEDAAQEVDSSIVVNDTEKIKQINFLNSGGLKTEISGNTAFVSLLNNVTEPTQITVKDEGTTRTTNVTSINFTGIGVQTAVSQGEITVSIPGINGGSGGISSPVTNAITTQSGVAEYSIQGYTSNTAENYLVFLNGQVLTPYTDYVITLNTITLLNTPADESVLIVFAYQLPVQGGSGIIVQEDNVVKSTSPSVLNFQGDGVDIVSNGTAVNIQIPGNNSITLQSNGNDIVDNNGENVKIGCINFAGDNISLTVTDSIATIHVDNVEQSQGFTGISISSNGRLLGGANSVSTLILEGLGVGASTTLNSNTVRVQVPGTLIKNEGIDVGFANTINFVGAAINASLNSNGVATIDSTAIANNTTAFIQSLTASSLSFPASAISTVTGNLSSNSEFLLVNVQGVTKAIKLFDIV